MAQPPMDPSHSVPQELMPHVHLVSSSRYPAIPRLDPNEVAKWLINAPHIARDKATVFWTYLDKPQDGTVLLTWQPLQRLGVNFATDGYIWAPPEQVFKHDLGNGLILEVYINKAGFVPGEQYCTHTRRRFRLIPAPGNPNPPQVDVSLFIVHYGPADPNDRIPANMIQHDERMNHLLQQRHYLTRGGQIRRKEFMLSDRVHWPSLPELINRQMAPQMTPRGVPQQMAYPPQPTVGPPAKRARHSQSQAQAQAQAQQAQMPGAGVPELPDDEEDITRGDIFDHLTPREISVARYRQNHEWMEEILSSPYRINQITPADLGLGLKGELASLTEGIFAAHAGGAQETSQLPEKAYVGRLDAGLADKFRQRVQEHIETTKSEIEKMQAEHAQALAEFKKGSTLSTKEKELRTLVEGTGQEVWRVEVESRGDNGKADNSNASEPKHSLEEIIKQAEEATGKKIQRKPTADRIQDGGYQIPVPEPEPEPVQQPDVSADAGLNAPSTNMSRQPSNAGSQASAALLGDSDMDMGGTAAGLLDQMHTGFSSNSTPINNFPTPQAQLSAAQSNAATPTNANVASPAPQGQAAPATASADVNMGGTEAEAKQSSTTPDQGTGSGDWVVVPKEGAASDAAAGSNAGTAHATPSGEAQKAPSSTETPSAPKPVSAAATPGLTDGGYDQNDFSSLGDLDTAGDALASFDDGGVSGNDGGDGLGDDLDLQMEMEDSAFGDAFHGAGSGAGETPGDGQNQDL
ncbi:SWI/SNF and RSC complex subunit Ssr4 [Sarocladium strictum]